MAGTPKIIWNEQKLKELEYLSGIGLTQKDIANFMSIGESTFQRYAQNNPDIGEVLRRGKVQGKTKLLQTAHQKAVNKQDSFLLTWLLARIHGMGEKQSEDERSFKQFSLEEIKAELNEAQERNKETVKRLELTEQFQSSS